MYARELMFWLHERLALRDTLEQSQKRFESLRGNALLPRGRENAGVRLSDEQIASAVLAYGYTLPGGAGHASLIWGNLLPVGGAFLHLENKTSLQGAVAALLDDKGNSYNISRMTLSVEQDFHGEEYTAVFYFRDKLKSQTISFVSKYAHTLLVPGAEKDFNHERLSKISAIQRSFSSSFFRDLSNAISVSRHLNHPLKTDWREYETEEEKDRFHKQLGARRSSRFLNLRVDAQVKWPKEPTRMEFGGYHLVLFPKTKENSHSVSIDLSVERISAADARSLINRMLSVMSWCDDQPASLHEGWSGNPVPVPVSRKDLAFSTMHDWCFFRSFPDNEDLLRCLAYYRDGLNAYSSGLASHAVLSFFRVFELKYDKKEKAISWINSVIPEVKQNLLEEVFIEFEEDRESKGVDYGTYIYVNCRVATAHAARDAPSDPDGAEETRRLLNASSVIKEIARHFIKQEFNFSDNYISDEP